MKLVVMHMELLGVRGRKVWGDRYGEGGERYLV